MACLLIYGAFAAAVLAGLAMAATGDWCFSTGVAAGVLLVFGVLGEHVREEG